MTVLSAPTLWPASSASVKCRSDSAVILSNGMVLDLSADIDTPVYNVKRVRCVLHVPFGVSLVSSIATPSWPTTMETFDLYADTAPGEYHSATVVYTMDSHVAITARTALVSRSGQQLDAGSAQGFSRKVIHVYLTAL